MYPPGITNEPQGTYVYPFEGLQVTNRLGLSRLPAVLEQLLLSGYWFWTDSLFACPQSRPVSYEASGGVADYCCVRRRSTPDPQRTPGLSPHRTETGRTRAVFIHPVLIKCLLAFRF
ncbi:hypothetical protein OJAV_G00169300 [Oryzias javanicus]|uniref:Uncharacterized protein n=1 Tax=Oryzias javanicus TaxID=123683 RepID=A0A437CEL3_ORYJA|nr:hypothetical protein OJAV_G00169300 [Oryzias javanicus]